MTLLEYYIEQVEQFISALTDDIKSGYGTIVTQTKLAVYREVLEYLEEIEQKPKTGRWIEHPEIETSAPEYLMFYECSECGDKQCFCKPDIYKKHFCNNCGAKMVESQERSDKE